MQQDTKIQWDHQLVLNKLVSRDGGGHEARILERVQQIEFLAEVTRQLDCGIEPRSCLLYLNHVERLQWVQLEREKNEIQHRLGTPEERHGDLERVRNLAHDMRNLLTVAVALWCLANEKVV